MNFFNCPSLNTVITKDQWIKWNTSVWSIDLSMETLLFRNRGTHPCPSTPEINFRLMLLFSKPNEVILSLFLELALEV